MNKDIAEWCYLRVQWNPVLGDPPLYPHSIGIVLPKVEQGRCP